MYFYHMWFVDFEWCDVEGENNPNREELDGRIQQLGVNLNQPQLHLLLVFDCKIKDNNSST